MERHEPRIVPATLDLVERARVGLDGLVGTMDPALDWEPYFLSFTNCRPAYMLHWSSMVSGVFPKYLEAITLLQCMAGADSHAREIRGMVDAILRNTREDGLIYDRADSRRPWNVGAGYGRKSWNEDYSCLAGDERLVCGMDWRYQLTGEPEWLELMRRACERMLDLAVWRGEHAWYPNVGCGNDFSYPRTSGWVHRDEPRGPQEGGEGATTFYLTQPIRGLIRWYRRSGDERMLALCRGLARFVMLPKFWGGMAELDPSYGASRAHWWGHFHGNLAALRGLLEYGLAAEDWRALCFVRDGYEWARHHIEPRLGLDAALEGCCTGDLVALGIQLSEAGIGDYWDDVDHVVRNALCAAQATDAALLRRVGEAGPERPAGAPWGAVGDWRFSHGLVRAPLEGQECAEGVVERTMGCFAWQLVAGRHHSPVYMQCCTANGNQGFYYAWDAVARSSGGAAVVNLWLNRFSPWVDVESSLPFEGRVVVTNKCCRRIDIRVPGWVPRKSVQVQVNDRRIEPAWLGRVVTLDALGGAERITLSCPLASEKLTVTLPSINARPFRGNPEVTAWFRGSTCTGLEPAPENVSGAEPVLYPAFHRPEMQAERTPTAQVPDRVVPRPIAWM